MRLILTADVDELGRKGDVVEVSDGYARNYLLPKRKAVKATPGAIAEAERVKAIREAAERRAREEAERIASQLAGTRVVIAAQAGDEGKLYGSVTASDVIEGIKKFTGVELERKQIDLRSPIRAIGLHEVWIRLHPDVEFPITLDVIPA
ncbi:MAG: 50S ribosomal protein L9 [Acidimicrobiia bacterium]|nr:MAG: 50S ribosomal protein L9 [Acidimicrobiia bacterium]